MRTRNGNQDPTVERELEAIDATLGGQPVDAGLTELAELVIALRNEGPRPSATFAETLDARAAVGFPPVDEDPAAEQDRPQRPRSGLMTALRRRRLQLAFGTAASLLIVATALVSTGVLTDDSSRPQSDSRDVLTDEAPADAPPAALESDPQKSGSDSAAGAAAPSLAPPIGRTGGGVRPDVRNRQQDRDAAIVLATPRSDVEDTADGVIQVTDRYQGFVLRSNVSGGDEGRAGATLELRIPSDRLQPALRDLSELAHVRSRTQTTQDITARFVSARSRLNEAVVERRALLRQLARATTPTETASIRARLRLANRRIAAARSDLRGLRNRVDFSSISVAIEADESVKAADSGWTPGEALRDAGDILRTTLGVLLVSLAVLLPLAVLGLVAWFASGIVRRAYRERALDRAQI
jgi:hypothetical protein